MGGMPGYMVPPPGLTPPDFSIWSIPPLEVPLPPGLPASPLYWPPVGRATSLRIVQQAQGYGVTSTSGGVTNLSTPMGGMPGYVVPPPGLTPPDFSIWSIPPLEVPPPPGLPASPLYQPPFGRATSLRAAIDRQAQAMRAMAPQAPKPLAPKSQAPLLQAPQMVPPVCQPLPPSGSQPATPYQQAVQLPVKPKGRGVTFDSSIDKVVAIGGQDTDGHERQRTTDDKMIRPSPPVLAGEHVKGPLIG